MKLKTINKSKSLQKRRNQTGYENLPWEINYSFGINYLLSSRIRLCRRIAHCRLEDSVAVELWDKTLVWGSWKNNTLARDRGRRRLFDHMRNHGEQWETLWESGKTIRHLTQEESQDTWNEREVSAFKIKQEMTRQDMNQNLNRDISLLGKLFICLCLCSQLAGPIGGNLEKKKKT